MGNYNVDLTWKTGRMGEVSSPEINNAIAVATPPEFKGGMSGVWSPEHFFTAAVNSCFMTTFLAIAENSKLEFNSFDCKATGILEQVDGKYLMTKVALEAFLNVPEGTDKEKVERVLQKSEKACLISNSIKSEVHLKTHIKVAETV